MLRQIVQIHQDIWVDYAKGNLFEIAGFGHNNRWWLDEGFRLVFMLLRLILSLILAFQCVEKGVGIEFWGKHAEDGAWLSGKHTHQSYFNMGHLLHTCWSCLVWYVSTSKFTMGHHASETYLLWTFSMVELPEKFRIQMPISVNDLKTFGTFYMLNKQVLHH